MDNQKNQFMPVTDLLKKALDIFSKGVEPFLILTGILIGVTFGIVMIFLVLGFIGGIGIGIFMEASDLGGSTAFTAIMISAIVIFFLLYILSIIFIPILGQMSLIKATDDVVKNKKRTIKEYLQYVWNLKWKIWGVYLLSALLIITGFVFLIIPGIVIGFCLMFAPYILILEDKKITECIKESFVMVKNNFLDYLWKHLLVFIAFMFGFTIINFIPLVNMVASFLVSVFSVIYIYLIYADIKKVRNSTVDK